MNSNTVTQLTVGSLTLNKIAADIRMIVGLLLSGLDWEDLKQIKENAETFGAGEWALQITAADEFQVWMGGTDSPYCLCTASYDRVPGRLSNIRHATVTPNHVPFVHSELNALADGMIARFVSVQRQVEPILNAAHYAEKLAANS